MVFLGRRQKEASLASEWGMRGINKFAECEERALQMFVVAVKWILRRLSSVKNVFLLVPEKTPFALPTVLISPLSSQL